MYKRQEVIGLPNGSIGDALYRAEITLSTGELFAWTFVIILLSAGFEKLFLLLLDLSLIHILAIFLMGKSAGDIAFYAYIVPFLISTAVGSIIAGVLVYSLQRSGALRSMQNSLS